MKCRRACTWSPATTTPSHSLPAHPRRPSPAASLSLCLRVWRSVICGSSAQLWLFFPPLYISSTYAVDDVGSSGYRLFHTFLRRQTVDPFTRSPPNPTPLFNCDFVSPNYWPAPHLSLDRTPCNTDRALRRGDGYISQASTILVREELRTIIQEPEGYTFHIHTTFKSWDKQPNIVHRTPSR